MIKARIGFWAITASLALSSCGIVNYPGQEGLVTDGYSKIDLEYLGDDGLWTYEVNYDNRNTRAHRLGAVITKLYPGAQTYTSNARTNADGTLYWCKGQYQGALMEMISTPKLNQVVMPPDSKVQLMISYDKPMDEIDDRNIAEEHLFDNRFPLLAEPLSSSIGESLRLKWSLLRAGQLLPTGALSYQITGIDLGGKKFTPSSPLTIETNFAQNGVRARFDSGLQSELAAFIEANYPTGFNGETKFFLKDVANPITTALAIHTPKTAGAAGMKVIRSATQRQMAEMVEAIGRADSR